MPFFINADLRFFQNLNLHYSASEPQHTAEAQQAFDDAAADAARKMIARQWGECPPTYQKAVIFNLAFRKDRWDATQKHLFSVGICPAKFSACGHKDVVQLTSGQCKHSKSRCIESPMARNGSLYTCHGRLVAGVHDWLPTNYLFNGLTQIKGWLDLAPMVSKEEWVLFLEDDVAVHPSMAIVPMLTVPKLIDAALATSANAGHGVAYFGLCGPVCSESTAFASSGQVLADGGGGGGGQADLALSYKPCTGACGHAYAMRGEALQALSRQAKRTIAHVQQRPVPHLAGASSDKSECEAYVACLHDPFGTHEMLRQGCTSFGGGWLDAATGRVPSAQGAGGIEKVKPIVLPNLKLAWRGIEVCGNFYGHDLGGPCKEGHNGLFYQNRALLKSDHSTNCI